MFDVELTYLTNMGNLRMVFTSSERVGTKEEAETLRGLLRSRFTSDAHMRIVVKNAKPLPTIDEAMERFTKTMQEYPPCQL